jgi:eukaryotic-like serine/threonine-protein kinase
VLAKRWVPVATSLALLLYGAAASAAKMPKIPLDGQRRPPCRAHLFEREILGGCWVEQERLNPPCADGYYEWEGNCYLPVFRPQREPVSTES